MLLTYIIEIAWLWHFYLCVRIKSRVLVLAQITVNGLPSQSQMGHSRPTLGPLFVWKPLKALSSSPPYKTGGNKHPHILPPYNPTPKKIQFFGHGRTPTIVFNFLLEPSSMFIFWPRLDLSSALSSGCSADQVQGSGARLVWWCRRRGLPGRLWAVDGWCFWCSRGLVAFLFGTCLLRIFYFSTHLSIIL